MNLENNEIVNAVLETVDKFAHKELADRTLELDKYPYSDYASQTLDKVKETGILLTTASDDLGGAGMPAEAWALILEKVAYVDAGFAASLMAHAMALQAILNHAKGDVLNETIDKAPLAYPIYLQAEDSDRLPIIYKTEGAVRLKGSARMVANAPVAQKAVVVALKEGTPCICLVNMSSESKPKPMEMLGLRSCPVGDIVLDYTGSKDIFVLAEGADSIKALHDPFYASATAILLSSLKSSLDYAIEYGTERYQGGKAISEHSQLQHMYSKMTVEYMALRLALLKAVERKETDESSLALKILASEHAIRATTDGVQLLGGYGYTMEYPQERRMRDARQASELLGSSARQRMTIIRRRLGILS